MLNFVFLDSSRPDIAHLLVAMLQARQAVERRSWYPQESTGEDRWADVLADPRTRKRDHRVDSEVKQTACRLSDEPHATILVACSKCDWRAAYERMELMASYGAESTAKPAQPTLGLATNGTIAGRATSSRLTAEVKPSARFGTPSTEISSCVPQFGFIAINFPPPRAPRSAPPSSGRGTGCKSAPPLA
jgi:hypothetical protein